MNYRPNEKISMATNITETPLLIKREINATLYGNFPSSLASCLILATILFLELYISHSLGPILTREYLTIWYVALLSVLILRVLLLFWYHYTKSNSNLIEIQYYLFFLGAMLTAATFGILVSILMPSDIFYQTFVLIIISGIVAGAVQSLNPSYTICISYMFVLIVPALSWLAIEILKGHSMYIGIFISIILFCFFSVVVAKRNYLFLIDNIRLKYENITMNSRIMEQATHDMLTGLFNRYYLHDYIDLEIARSKRNKRKFAILMIDIDKFKYYNDKYGHDIGDLVLYKTANLLSSLIRSSDIVCRYGGDEFIILMNETTKEDALSLANRLLEASDKLAIHIYNKAIEKISLSIGISSYPENGDTDDILITAADKAMYQAKLKKHAIALAKPGDLMHE